MCDMLKDTVVVGKKLWAALAIVLVVRYFGQHGWWRVIFGGLHCSSMDLCQCRGVTVVHLESL